MTTFRVADAQLRQADGWVRCGRCNEVFKAIESMVDLARGGAPRVPAKPPPPPTQDVQAAHTERPGLRARLTAQPPLTARTAVRSSRVTAQETGAGYAASQGRPVVGGAGDGAAADPANGAARETFPAPEPATAPAMPLSVAGTDALPFSARTQRRPSPMSDEARLAWGAMAAFSGLALALQMLVAWHDPIGQRAPLLRPLVEVVCVIVECRIEPPRRLSLLSVESTEFHHLAGSIYRLTTRVRNRDTSALAMPSVDLTMTDANGQLVARKVLQPGDFGSRSRSIAAGQELTLQAVLDTGPRGVTGYTIELFYP